MQSGGNSLRVRRGTALLDCRVDDFIETFDPCLHGVAAAVRGSQSPESSCDFNPKVVVKHGVFGIYASSLSILDAYGDGTVA